MPRSTMLPTMVARLTSLVSDVTIDLNFDSWKHIANDSTVDDDDDVALASNVQASDDGKVNINIQRL